MTNGVQDKKTEPESVIVEVTISLLVILVAVWWISMVVLSYVPVSEEKFSAQHFYNIQLEFLNWFQNVNPSEIHPASASEFTVYWNGSLDIFIKRSSFESIAFPRRPKFVRSIGKLWCDSENVLSFPTVSFRDIRSGKKLAGHSCFFNKFRFSE